MNPNFALVTSGASAALTLDAVVALAEGLALVVAVLSALGVSPPPPQAFKAIALAVESPAVVKNLRREILIDFLELFELLKLTTN
jgi:hypothetical protein